MAGKSILIVEDESEIRELLSYNLRKEGFDVAGVASGQQAIVAAETRPPDLVLLDLLLPDVDGLTVCRRLKSSPRTRSASVIMVTAKGEETDIVSGLTVGADDYITKPFSPKVVVARVRAVLRRAEAGESQPDEDDEEGTIAHGDLAIRVRRHEVLVAGEPVDLTATEFRILRFLARKPGWVFRRHEILDGIHGDHYAITERAVDVQIVGLRKKLGAAGQYIETVRGVGYRFRG